MSQQDLLLLGLLKESPKHGYEIKKKIKEIPSLFAGVASKSIYYPLAALKKRDWYQGRSINMAAVLPALSTL